MGQQLHQVKARKPWSQSRSTGTCDTYVITSLTFDPTIHVQIVMSDSCASMQALVAFLHPPYLMCKSLSHDEAHLQVYLGGWLTEVAAAVAYDLGALWFWGSSAQINVSHALHSDRAKAHTPCDMQLNMQDQPFLST